MLNAKRIQPLIQWHDGMLLQPHHFQRLSLRYEHLMGHHVQRVPYNWGVSHFEIDTVAVLEGILRVTRLEAIMPDGTVVWHEATEKAPPLELNFSDAVTAAKSAEIHLALTIAATDGMLLKRFRSVESDPLPDMNTNDNEMALPTLVPRLRLVLSENLSQDMTSFPVARIVLKDEVLSLSEYVPPLLTMEADTRLLNRIGKVIESVRRKALLLEDKIKSTGLDLADRGVLELRGYVERLVSVLPYLEALYQVRTAPPFQFYLSLMLLVGQLAPLAVQLVPPLFDAYDHNDLEKSFQQVERYIAIELAQLTETYTAYTLHAANRQFLVPETRLQIEEPTIIGLKIEPGATVQDVELWVSQLIICSQGLLEEVLRKRVLGANRRVIKLYEPLGLVPPSGIVLMQIEANNTYIRADEPLVLADELPVSRFPPPQTAILYSRV